jgi:tRNA(fMet)-specific endonuclease VapC
MARVVVDTNVVSYLIKGDTRATIYRPHLSGQDLCLAFASVAELYRWAVRSRWGQPRIDALRAMLGGYTILVYDDDTAWEWARVMSLQGRPMSPADAWVAAVAVRHGLPLVTHNRKHFELVPGLTIVSEG